MPVSTTYYNFKPAGCVDADATAFTLAAGITDAIQKEAICVFVTALKAAGIWTKFRAIWPYVGGNATAHSFNLKDPTKFQLTFFNGFIHDALGVTGNGVNTYARTGFFPMAEIATQAELDNLSMGSYSTVVADGYDFGSFNNNNVYIIGMAKKNDSFYIGSALSADVYDFPHPNVGFSDGLSYIQRNSFQMEYYQGTTLLKQMIENIDYTDSGQSGISAYELDLFAININNVLDFFPIAGRVSLHFIAEYFNSTERADFYNAIQTLQTTLSRQL